MPRFTPRNPQHLTPGELSHTLKNLDPCGDTPQHLALNFEIDDAADRSSKIYTRVIKPLEDFATELRDHDERVRAGKLEPLPTQQRIRYIVLSTPGGNTNSVSALDTAMRSVENRGGYVVMVGGRGKAHSAGPFCYSLGTYRCWVGDRRKLFLHPPLTHIEGCEGDAFAGYYYINRTQMQAAIQTITEYLLHMPGSRALIDELTRKSTFLEGEEDRGAAWLVRASRGSLTHAEALRLIRADSYLSVLNTKLYNLTDRLYDVRGNIIPFRTDKGQFRVPPYMFDNSHSATPTRLIPLDLLPTMISNFERLATRIAIQTLFNERDPDFSIVDCPPWTKTSRGDGTAGQATSAAWSGPSVGGKQTTAQTNPSAAWSGPSWGGRQTTAQTNPSAAWSGPFWGGRQSTTHTEHHNDDSESTTTSDSSDEDKKSD